MTSKTRVLIIDAGIGGLATAIALQQAGFAGSVYEAASALRGIGAGISLRANATSVLEKLGLLDKAVAKSATLSVIKIKTERGVLLMQTDVEKYSIPAICLHRAVFN